jgi:excisionase family DNA binding protein
MDSQQDEQGDGDRQSDGPEPSTTRRSREAVEEVHDPLDRAALDHLLSVAPAGAVITFVRVVLPPAHSTSAKPTDGAEEPVKKWMTPKEVGVRLGIKPATVRDWVAEGRFPGTGMLPNGAYRIPIASVDALLVAAPTDTAHLADLSKPTSVSTPSNRVGTGNASFDLAKLGSWRAHLRDGHR